MSFIPSSFRPGGGGIGADDLNFGMLTSGGAFGDPSMYQMSTGGIGLAGSLPADPAMVTPNLGAFGSAGGIGAAGRGSGFGLNMGTAQLGLTGLNTIGNLWAAWKQQKLASEQFKFTKGITTTNLNNQIKSYNTSLDDRVRSRSVVEGTSAADAAAYYDKNKMTR
jgi:hypothetical protein